MSCVAADKLFDFFALPFLYVVSWANDTYLTGLCVLELSRMGKNVYETLGKNVYETL